MAVVIFKKVLGGASTSKNKSYLLKHVEKEMEWMSRGSEFPKKTFNSTQLHGTLPDIENPQKRKLKDDISRCFKRPLFRGKLAVGFREVHILGGSC